MQDAVAWWPTCTCVACCMSVHDLPHRMHITPPAGVEPAIFRSILWHPTQGLHTLGAHVTLGSATPHVSSGDAHPAGRFGGSASPRRPGVILPPLPLQGGGWERQGPGARQGRRWRPLRLWEERGWLLGAGAGSLPQGRAWRPPEGRRGPYSGSVPQNEAMCGAASRADSRPGSPARAGAPLHGGRSSCHINTPPRGPCRHIPAVV